MRDTLWQDERLLGSTFDDGDDSLPGSRTDEGLKFIGCRLSAEAAVPAGTVVHSDGVERTSLVWADQGPGPVFKTLVGFDSLRKRTIVLTV